MSTVRSENVTYPSAHGVEFLVQYEFVPTSLEIEVTVHGNESESGDPFQWRYHAVGKTPRPMDTIVLSIHFDNPTTLAPVGDAGFEALKGLIIK